MEVDIHVVQELEQWDGMVQLCTENLSKSLDEEMRLELICLQFLKEFKVAQSLSLKEKFIQMRCLTSSGEVEGAVDEWVACTYATRKGELSLRQAEGKRDSLKKILTVLPK